MEDPACPHPEHTLDLWYNIKASENFAAFPSEINVKFTSPVPDGDDNLQLWSYSEEEGEWIPDSADEEVTVNTWNFSTSPDSVNYTTNHFSRWAMNNGDDGSLAYPPRNPENVSIVRNDETITVAWNEVTLDIGGFPIENVTYNIYTSESPYSGWTEVASGLTQTSWNEQISSDEKRFYRVTAANIP